jgi:hypothetical protein
MAVKLIFTDDRTENKSLSHLEIFANNDDMLTIIMEESDNDYSYNCIELTKESALDLIKHIQNQLDLI